MCNNVKIAKRQQATQYQQDNKNQQSRHNGYMCNTVVHTGF